MCIIGKEEVTLVTDKYKNIRILKLLFQYRLNDTNINLFFCVFRHTHFLAHSSAGTQLSCGGIFNIFFIAYFSVKKLYNRSMFSKDMTKKIFRLLVWPAL